MEAEVACLNQSFGCPARVQRKNMARHIFQECPCSLVMSWFMSKPVHRKDFMETQTKKFADSIPRMSCPLSGYGCTIRNNLSHHMRECKYWKVVCPRCSEEVAREAYYDHQCADMSQPSRRYASPLDLSKSKKFQRAQAQAI